MIGGGEGSQIGPAHRLGALADGHFTLAAGALDHRPDVGRDYAQRLGVAQDRAYGDWKEMLAGERNRPDRCDLVTVATPNSTHFDITKAFLEAGFNVLCEKPMTVTVEEGEEIVRIAAKTGKICAVNYCYSAYPMIRQARAMVRNGDIASAGAMTRPWQASRASSPIAASTRCTWPASSATTRWKNSPPTSPRPSPRANSKMTPWSTSACQRAQSGGSGPRRSPSGGNTALIFRSLAKPAASAGRQNSPTS
jgi:predicted dehydrogenase